MKKNAILFFIGVFTLALVFPVYASDWDKAGKILTVVEGMRILTGGKVDIVGNITGINKPYSYAPARPSRARYVHSRPARPEKVWVPHYVWRNEYVPAHREYQPGYGSVVVEGHYVQYQVEQGGHWEWRDCYPADYSYHRVYR
ncbi:MAG: hypothetical protein JXD21_06995 [Candidatus Omnitrophica bacterium]|nr:hypothetical protein [Candidatus Omnitrophota bacterium]